MSCPGINTTINAAPSSTNILNLTDTAFLDSFIPGYSILSRFLASYLHIDLSSYLPLILAATVAAASLPYGVGWLRQFSGQYLTSTAEIRLDDEIYNYLMFWMAQQPFTTRTIHFVAGTRISSSVRWWDSDDEGASGDDDDDDTDDDDGDDIFDGDSDGKRTNILTSFDQHWARVMSKDKYRPLRFTPAEGSHYFWFRGHLLAFIRERQEGKGGGFNLMPERLYISCLGRNPTILKELLAEAQRAYVARDGNRTIIYRGQKNGMSDFNWVRCMARPPRPLSTVVLAEAQKQAFVDDLKEYLHPRTRRWYSNRGIPYRRGYLLHGPPGTGKTSLCFAASGLLGLTLYLLSLNSKTLDEDSLMSLFAELPRRCIVLLEDVDSAGITQKRAEEDTAAASDAAAGTNSADKKDKPNGTEDQKSDTSSGKGISLSALLNVIDGVAASEGRVLIMTTNHAEKLDPALLRPGRVDMSIEFGYADREAMRDLFTAIYSVLEGDLRTAKGRVARPAPRQVKEKEDSSVMADQKRKRITDLADEFASRIPEGEFTAAEIQGHLLNYKNEPEAAIKTVEQWVASIREKRKELEQQ
ncbi:BCS1 and AAA domain-containing protein [Aspergillus clavatus NRRL 1]|uniref:BCS1-like ATPase, putative n=1 Tax=Aspergillus clavatus (strain ATCC 1007 / CBS 513.65 / DSM 816 / NCTC 3887 / NRRL 1 / QM 1276 / 107) TaxID=344612 RepID=A1C768_ASPCL|nr:BCS1-like ATPase, putative [Aspergillus clavatus NRRL 1]EAW14239.1 BCS1-like ATPase, putative [Aspergillus clavatus NRRL 1]